MKTISPCCKQEFPDTPDNYQGMTLECPVCGKEFVCEKAKICSACGAACSAKALKCVQCGTFFPSVPAQRPFAPPPRQNYNETSPGTTNGKAAGLARFSSKCGFYCVALAILYIVLGVAKASFRSDFVALAIIVTGVAVLASGTFSFVCGILAFCMLTQEEKEDSFFKKDTTKNMALIGILAPTLLIGLIVFVMFLLSLH